MTSFQRIAFVVHESVSKKLIESNQIDIDFLELVQKAPWGSRPNSTTRLTLANLKAVHSLVHDFDIHFLTATEFTNSLGTELGQYDLIVVNSIASAPSIRFTVDLLTYRESQIGYPKIVVGTEATWAAQVKNGNITQAEYDLIYFGDCLLRHTARTDREIYTRSDVHQAVLQEFELAIDQALFRDTAQLERRKTITFVKAPEGRKTKNNEAIEKVLSLLSSDARFEYFTFNVVEPPYSIADYWRLLGETSYLVFTSLGETFSYALNDAKALGAVTFLPRQMYYSTIGRRFAVDGYPDIGIKYDNIDEIPEKILGIEASPSGWTNASHRSKTSCLNRFDLSAVTQNWKTLFTGRSLNTNSLYVVSEADGIEYEEIASRAREHGCEFAISIHNAGMSPLLGSLADVHEETGTTMLAYYLSMDSYGLHRYIETIDGTVVANNSIPVTKEDRAQSEAFLQLICRTNKVGKIVTTGATIKTAGQMLARLTHFSGLTDGLRPIHIETV